MKVAICTCLLLVVLGVGHAAEPKVQIVGHRGSSYEAPENTLASVNLSWKEKADGTEIDVYLSKDGKIVVIHDKSTKRTTGVEKIVAESTLEELRALDAGSWKNARYRGEKIPTLEEVLKTIPANKQLFIEVKCGPEIIPELQRVLKAGKRKDSETVIISFNADVIAGCEKVMPQLVSYWVVGLYARGGRTTPSAEALIDKAREIKADGLDLSANEAVLTADFAKKILEAKLLLGVWTVNDVELARKMIKVGVQAITTDRPGWLREQLKN